MPHVQYLQGWLTEITRLFVYERDIFEHITYDLTYDLTRMLKSIQGRSWHENDTGAFPEISVFMMQEYYLRQPVAMVLVFHSVATICFQV